MGEIVLRSDAQSLLGVPPLFPPRHAGSIRNVPVGGMSTHHVSRPGYAVWQIEKTLALQVHIILALVDYGYLM